MQFLNKRLVWIVFCIAAFIILTIQDIKNWKLFPRFIKEFREIVRKRSIYIEDGDYEIVPRKFKKWKKLF